MRQRVKFYLNVDLELAKLSSLYFQVKTMANQTNKMHVQTILIIEQLCFQRKNYFTPVGKEQLQLEETQRNKQDIWKKKTWMTKIAQNLLKSKLTAIQVLQLIMLHNNENVEKKFQLFILNSSREI